MTDSNVGALKHAILFRFEYGPDATAGIPGFENDTNRHRARIARHARRKDVKEAGGYGWRERW